MSIANLKIEGATKRSTKKHAAVTVPLTTADGKAFKAGGDPITVSLRPNTGADWEAETQKWLARWGEAAQFKDNPDLNEEGAQRLGQNRMQAMTEIRARSIADWSLSAECSLDNRIEFLTLYPAIGEAVDREVRRITGEIETAAKN